MDAEEEHMDHEGGYKAMFSSFNSAMEIFPPLVEDKFILNIY